MKIKLVKEPEFKTVYFQEVDEDDARAFLEALGNSLDTSHHGWFHRPLPPAPMVERLERRNKPHLAQIATLMLDDPTLWLDLSDLDMVKLRDED